MRHKIGLYVRVSTEEQAQVIEGSLESQKHRLRNFVDIKNMQDSNWGKVIETYSDEGLSAKDTRRPAFQRMMKDIRSEKINLILVTDLSRLSRNILDFCILLEDLKKVKAKFLSIKEQFDTSTPSGEMMVFNMINLAQFERKQTSERVAMNFHARALRGLRNGGSIVLGYDVDPAHPGRYIVNEVEAHQVRRIFQIYREVCSLRQTIKMLELEGIKPKARMARNDHHNLAGRWTIDSLTSILKNYAYIGLREVNAKNKDKDQESLRPYERYQITKAAWDQIIDEKSFYAVQEIRVENLKNERQRRSLGESRTFLLSGKIYCNDCGRPLVGSAGHGRNRIYRYYVHRKIAGMSQECSLRTINAEELEQKVLNHIDEILFREGYLDSIEARLKSVYRQSTLGTKAQAAALQAELSQIDREIRSTIRLISEMTEDGMDVMLKETLKNLKSQKDLTQRQFETVNEQQVEINDATIDRKYIEAQASLLKRAKSKASPQTLKRLLSKIISAITINDDVAKVAYWKANEIQSPNHTTKTQGASDKTSEASSILSSGHRLIKKILEFENIPPLAFSSGVQASVGGYIVGNGPTDWI